jgi:hypothetical protein
MNLKPLTAESYDDIYPFYQNFHINASELSFTNLFMWRHKYQFHYVILENYLWICNIKNESTYYFSQPLGDYSDKKGLYCSINTLFDFLSEKNMKLIVKKADIRFVEAANAVGFTPTVEEDRNSFDYIYDFSELSALSGNKYHKKKNHINKFMKTIPEFSYIPLTPESLPLLVQQYHHWFDENQREGQEQDFAEEKLAIKVALDHYGLLKFKGGMIEIEGKIQAYTLGEALNNDTLLVHIEKANNDIPGLYPLINQLFLQNQTESFTWVNREQDLGLEGLRKAKLSYHPVSFTKKYILRFS